MAYQVKLLNFEGPLDLLLQLVERSQLPASELSLADLTEQYLQHSSAIEGLDQLETSHFAALASQLLYLKSYALLPTAEDTPEEIVELQEQLAVYAGYRQAAATLATALDHGGRSWSRRRATRPQRPGAAPNITPAALRQALVGALAKTSRSQYHQVAAQTITLPAMMRRLEQAGDGDATMSLQAFFEQLQSRLEVTVAFLAALELWRKGALELKQDGQFSTIQIDYA